MGMKKSDVKDVTIRSVGDVTSISVSENKKAGVVSGPAGTVAAPATSGNLSGAPSALSTINAPHNPSLDGLPLPEKESHEPDDLAQPSMGTTPEADSVQTSPVGKSISFPSASDTKSAGGIKTVTSLVEKTGAKVSFPAASNTTGPIKSVTSFGKP